MAKGKVINLRDGGEFTQDTMDNIRNEELARSYQDDMTLGDIKENDEAMMADALKNCVHHSFGQNMEKCLNFMGFCVDCTLKYCGVKVPIATPIQSRASDRRHARALEKAMKQQKVKIERRKKYSGMHNWKNGLYIYKDDVIVAFISEPLRFPPKIVAVNRGKTLGIITNAPTEGKIMVAG